MKKFMVAIMLAIVIVSTPVTVYAFTDSQEDAIERMCKKAEEADKLVRSIIRWIKAD